LLPKVEGGKEPLPEGLFWLMLTGELPTKEQVDWLSDEWEKRAEVPAHTFAALDALSPDTHPMTQFSIGIVSMQSESVFAKRYAEGMGKHEYWDIEGHSTEVIISSRIRHWTGQQILHICSE